jgi:HPt (histidine-containing phosphotransfer) domain-containing protein
MFNIHSSGLLEINWERLRQISDADSEFELELLNMLAVDLEAQLVNLQVAIEQQNADKLKHLAHYIKGAAANVGVISISSIAHNIEEKAIELQFAEVHQLILALTDQQQQFAAYLLQHQ